jgi:CRP/FNR family transcriptional regulator, cyclic AMP receptor protein
MKIQGLDSIIASHVFFAGLEAADVAMIAGCAENVRYQAGEPLFRAGDPASHFFVVRTGKVVLELHPPGRDVFRFATVGEHEVLGWAWLIPPYRWLVDARALEVTRLLRFDGTCLRGKCDADPRLGYVLMQRFAQVLVKQFNHLQLQLMDIYGRDG